MRTRAICLAAVLTACSDPAPEPTPPPPQANVDPQQLEFFCGNYASMPAEQVEACTSLIGLYGDASANRSRLALAHLTRGTAHKRAGDGARAETDYREAIRLHSIPIDSGEKEVINYNDRCWARAVSGIDLDGALADCNEALRLMPDFVPALDSRAFLHLRGGRFQEAIADYDTAIMGSPQDSWSLYGRGIAKMRMGDAQGGQADIDASKAVQDVAGEFAAYGLTP
jgi:tetratricopeptide (TPR) repeat protein